VIGSIINPLIFISISICAFRRPDTGSWSL